MGIIMTLVYLRHAERVEDATSKRGVIGFRIKTLFSQIIRRSFDFMAAMTITIMKSVGIAYFSQPFQATILTAAYS